MSISNLVKFFTAQAASGNGLDQVVNFRGNQGMLFVDGGFGGGTFTLQIKTLAGNYVGFNNNQGSAISLTTASAIPLNMIPYGATMRGVLTGATSPTLNAYLREVNTGR